MLLLQLEAGPENYRERVNSVPRKANNWQEGRNLFHEKSGIYMVFWGLEEKRKKLHQLVPFEALIEKD